MSVMGPGFLVCQVSISVCRRSRSASKAMFFGASSRTMASKPFQKSALFTPVPGSTSFWMKRCRAVSTCKLWTGVRAVMGVFLVAAQKEADPGIYSISPRRLSSLDAQDS
jgi:hypothetical protein